MIRRIISLSDWKISTKDSRRNMNIILSLAKTVLTKIISSLEFLQNLIYLWQQQVNLGKFHFQRKSPSKIPKRIPWRRLVQTKGKSSISCSIINIIHLFSSFDSNDDENINLKNYQTDDDLIKPISGSLSTIDEDCSNLEAVNEDEED